MRKFLLVGLLLLWSSVISAAEIVATEPPFFDTSGAVASPNPGPAMVVAAEPIMRLGSEDQGVFSVRCWQDGQLILEDANWSAPQLSADFIAMSKVGNPAPGLYLVDFQKTFCELKRQGAQPETAAPGDKR